MFDQLVESQPQRARSPLQLAISIAVHTTIIAISIQLTRAVAESVVRRPVAVDMHLDRPPTPRVSTAAAAPSPTASVNSVAPIISMPVAPIVVPTSIPPVEAGPKFDPRAFGQRSTVGTQFDGPPSGTADQGLPATIEQVDEAVVYLEGPKPVYPPALRQVGVEGSVVLRYIVGLDGKVEGESITVLQTTNHAFDAPAIDAIAGARFKAARIHGRAVRQLVEQVVRFTLGRP